MFDKVLCLVETQKDINLDVICDQENWINGKSTFPEKTYLEAYEKKK